MPQHPKEPNPEIKHLNGMIHKYSFNIGICGRHLLDLTQHEHERMCTSKEHAEKCGSKLPVPRPAIGDKVAWEEFFSLLDETSRLQSQPHSHEESVLSPLLYIIPTDVSSKVAFE